jgi:hypothetical protein
MAAEADQLAGPAVGVSVAAKNYAVGSGIESIAQA